jgi:hypothetical protein
VQEATRKPVKKTSFYSGTYPTLVPDSLLRAPSNSYSKDMKPAIKKEHPPEYAQKFENFNNNTPPKFSAISQSDRSCFAQKQNLKPAIHRNAGQAYMPPPPPLEDDKEMERKKGEAQKVDNEKEKYQLIIKDHMRSFIKKKLETHGLKKADGKTLPVLEAIMDRFYKKRLLKLVKIARVDQKNLNDLLSSKNIGKEGLAGDRDYLHTQRYLLRNKFVDKNQEHAEEYTQLQVLYTSDTKGKLAQTDEGRMKIVREKKERILKLKDIEHQKLRKKGKRGRKKLGEENIDEDDGKSDQDMDDEISEDSDSPSNRKNAFGKQGVKGNAGTGNIFDVDFENNLQRQNMEEGGERMNTLDYMLKKPSMDKNRVSYYCVYGILV